jgi:hypothetical protein
VQGTDEVHLGGGSDAETSLLAAVAGDAAAHVPTEPAVAGNVAAPVEGVLLPPPGDECQLPDDLVEGYGIKDTRVLTSSEPPSS